MIDYMIEPQRETPIAGECDVLVCGGGPAGVAAAIYAARLGAQTRLLEVHGCLGGVWTAGLLSYVLDAGNKTGLIREIIARHEAYWNTPVTYDESHDLPWVVGSFFYDAEVMKLVLEELCREAGVVVQYHTRLVSAPRDAQGGISAVVTESKSGRQAWKACVFVDATGDGDLAALAGCSYEVGHPQTGETQPMSLMGLVAGVRAEEMQPFLTGLKGEGGRGQLNLYAEMSRAGVRPSYARPVLAHIGGGLFALMANHEYGASGLDAAQMTQATQHARQELHRLVGGLRRIAGPWANLRLVATGAQIGVREGRRIRGRYEVGVQDLIEGRSQPDAVCRVTFPVDVHSTNREQGTGYTDQGVGSRPYDIPLRSLIAAEVGGLLLAGRCISGDFLAHASYRVTGNAVAMGEAAGVTAALAASTSCQPDQVRVSEVMRHLTKIRSSKVHLKYPYPEKPDEGEVS